MQMVHHPANIDASVKIQKKKRQIVLPASLQAAGRPTGDVLLPQKLARTPFVCILKHPHELALVSHDPKNKCTMGVNARGMCILLTYRVELLVAQVPARRSLLPECEPIHLQQA